MPRCVIIKCNSPTISSTKRQGHISYHSFPHDPNIKEKWIAATGRKGWFPTKHSTICSVHFDNTSFIEGKKMRLLKKTAFPTINILKFIDNDYKSPVEMESSEELVACRACLAADGRLYAISGSGLEDTLAALTGTALPKEDSLPRHLCVYCMAKLSKCAAFRDSCQRSAALLKTLSEKGSLKMNFIEAYNRKSQPLTNKLTHNKLFHFGTDSFIEIMPLIKTENNENSHEEAKCAEVYIESENYVKKDASDVDKCTLELPIEKRERSGSKVVKSRTKNTECIKVEVEIENDNAHSELDDCIGSEVGNDTSDVDTDASEETLAAVRNRKRTKITLTKNNTAKRPKKPRNLLTEDKHPTEINTDTSEATTGLNKTVGIKSVGAETAFEKKNNRNTKALDTDVKKPKLQKRKRRNKSIYSCDLCGKEYKSESNLKTHKSRHDPNMSKETIATLKKDADLEFEKKYNFEIKLLSKEEQKQRIEERKKNMSAHSCDVCGKDHNKESTLAAHKTSYHDPSLPVECDVCFYRFRSRQELRKHQLEDRHRATFTCNECGHVTRSRMYAKDHCLMHRGKTFACPYCDMKYDRQSSYYGHMRLQHPGENEACDECGETFTGKVGLLVHKRLRHKTNDNPNENFKCSVCEVKFSSPEALQRHLELSVGVPHAALWPCVACGDTCGSEPALAAHAAEKHPPEQRYCKECNKTFADASSFALHVDRKHKNRRAAYVVRVRRGRIVCEICGKVFMCLATLQYHMNGHLGLRPFQCSHCSKAFTHKTKLMLHMRVHTGEKPYQCEQCPLAFSARGNFTRHVKNVHLRVQVECETCGKTMGAGSLPAHVRAVHMNQPYVRRKRDRTGKTQTRIRES